jgi:hypothetical protein
VWWGCEINGRVFKLTPDGVATTIVGRKRNRSVLTYDPEYPGLTEADIDTRITNLGNFPAGVTNLGGANDLCFDPRDSNILYVAAQVDNWIARINLTTLNVTVYAGTPGDPGGYTGDGSLALGCKFSQPTSIIMDATGIMYVNDFNNAAIRKILPGTGTAAGTISTLCGGTVGPTPPAPSGIAGTAASYAVSSIVWDSMTNTGTVVMAAPTTIKLGYSLNLSGATNTGTGSFGDPNTAGDIPRYVVISFADSQHFTVGFDRGPGGRPTIVTIGGSPVFTVLNSDVYSSPTSVSFANAYLAYPNVIRFTSSGDIVFFEVPTYALRRIHLGSGTITRIGIHDNVLRTAGSTVWGWCTVDTAGVGGPIDDIVTGAFDDAVKTWRYSLDGSYAAEFLAQGWSLSRYGPSDATGGIHYPWAMQWSRFEGRMIATGTASFNPIVIRIKQPSDPVVNVGSSINFNEAALENAGQIVFTGTVDGFPFGVRPSLWNLRGAVSMGFIMDSPGHNSYDDLNATYPTDAGMAAYIQAGMGGAVPRPEIVGNQMRNLCYGIRRGTYAGGLGPTPVQPGPDDPNTEVPLILSVSAVRNSSTQITVSWTTDIPTLGMVASYTPGQWAIGAKASIYSDLESGFGTSHSMPCQVLAGLSPVHYTVVCEDQHGNFAHCVDQVLSEVASTIVPPNGSLETGYGTWSWGTEFSPAPSWGGAPFYRVLLNGKVVWGDSSAVGPFGAFQQMTVTNGGNLYAKGADQIWWSFTNYKWLDDGSPDLVPVPLPPPPSTFHPPYTPSADGTAITGGTGSVVTDDGVWSFGAASGSGWIPTLNGLNLVGPCDRIQVNAHGQAFLRNSDNGMWFVWEANTAFPATAPTSAPIPIAMDFSPSFATPAFLTPIGTIITTVSVKTSDGSPFTGTLSISGGTSPSDLGVSGMNLVTLNSPLHGNGQVFTVTATQNGCTYRAYFDINAM